jgi:hypothetical protein
MLFFENGIIVECKCKLKKFLVENMILHYWFDKQIIQ